MNKYITLLLCCLVFVGCKDKGNNISIGEINGGSTRIIQGTPEDTLFFINDSNLQLMPGKGVADTAYFYEICGKTLFSRSRISQNWDSIDIK